MNGSWRPHTISDDLSKSRKSHHRISRMDTNASSPVEESTVLGTLMWVKTEGAPKNDGGLTSPGSGLQASILWCFMWRALTYLLALRREWSTITFNNHPIPPATHPFPTFSTSKHIIYWDLSIWIHFKLRHSMRRLRNGPVPQSPELLILTHTLRIHGAGICKLTSMGYIHGQCYHI